MNQSTKTIKMPRKRLTQSIDDLEAQLLEAESTLTVARRNLFQASKKFREAKNSWEAQNLPKQASKNVKKPVQPPVKTITKRGRRLKPVQGLKIELAKPKTIFKAVKNAENWPKILVKLNQTMEDAKLEKKEAEEGVKRIKRAIINEKYWKRKKLSEPLNVDVFERPQNNDFTVEIFYDLLQFLERNEVEKCQLVSRFWNKSILIDVSILPLRKVSELAYDCQRLGQPYYYQRYITNPRPKFYISFENDEFVTRNGIVTKRRLLKNNQIRHGLKNCVFEKIEGRVLTKFHEKLGEIVKFNGVKLVAEKVFFNFIEEGNEDFEKKIQLLKLILSNLVSTHDIQLTIGSNCHNQFNHLSGNLSYLIRHPELLDFPMPMESIEIKSADYNLFIDTGLFMNFVSKCNTTSRRRLKLVLSGSNCNATNGPRIVEEFLEHKDPEMMIYNVYAGGYSGWQLAQLTKETLFQRGAERKVENITCPHHPQREVYTLKRNDGWRLKVFIPRHICNYVEFFVEKM